jgi:serine/threonine protein kinase
MIGEVVDKFAVRSKLGAGGLGEVWLGEHVETHHRVAIKMLTGQVSALPVMVKVFDEARMLVRIAGAGIAKVYDANRRPDGRAYVITELVAGESLAARISRGRMSSTQVADLVQQVARAVATAGSAGVTHGDLKPTNIFFVPDPDSRGGERVVVVDFAMGRLIAAAPDHGNPAYMAPEQFTNAAIDERADIYALACVAFECVTQRPPFTAKTAAEVRAKHRTMTPPMMKTLAPDVGAVLDALIARMLEKKPDDRPRSMREVTKRFELIVGMDAPLDETKQN